MNSICSRRLAVDPDDRLIGAADVVRIDGQVGHLPDRAGGGLDGLHPLLYRVLVRAGEGGVDELPGVWMPGVHGQLVALLGDPPHLIDVGEVEMRLNALAEEIQRKGHEVDVAGPLAVAEEGPLDALSARHQGQLGRRDGRAAVVVGMHAQNPAVAPVNVAVAPLDLVGVDVGRAHLDGRGQVEDHAPLRSRLPDLHHRLADLPGEIELGPREALRRVLVGEVGSGQAGRQLADQLGAANRHGDDAATVEAEDDAALERRGRVVQVDDRPLRACQALEGPLDELVAGLGEDLDGHVLGYQVFLDQEAHEIKVGL
jgi:hypothetical protein